MSREERTQVANQIVAELRKLSYGDCRALKKEGSNRIVRRGDKEFQVEIQARWDDRARTNVRVLVAVSEPGLSDFFPTTADFVIAPDGCLVGEDDSIKSAKS